jgi:iron(III) transport system permease protein
VTHASRSYVSARAVQILTYALVGFLVLLPIVPIVLQSFRATPLYDPGGAWTLSEYVALWHDATFWQAVRTTLIFGLLSTAISLAIGLAAAILVARTDLPGRWLVGFIMLWPAFVSHLVLALGWITAFGPSGFATLWLKEIVGEIPWTLYSLGGLSFAAGTSMAPLTYLYCIGAARTIDSTLESAARIAGAGPIRAMWTVSLPMLRPAVLASAILNFVTSIELLALPLLLGSPSGMEFLTTFVYLRGFEASTPRHGLVAAVAVVLLFAVTALVLIQTKLLGDTRRFVTVSGKATRPRLISLGVWRYPIAIAFLAFEALFIVAVLFAPVVRSFVDVLTPFVPIFDVLTLENFQSIFGYDQFIRSIWNTVLVALIGGFLGTCLIAAAALVSLRSDLPGAAGLGFLALYPRAVPGVLVGMGIVWAVAWVPGLSLLQNTIAILIVAFIMRYLPIGWGAIQPALLQISPDHDRAARSAGAGWLSVVTRVLLPQLRPALGACFMLLFVHFIKEYAAAVFLFAPGSEVIGTTMLTFWFKGDLGAVAALGTLQIAMVLVFMTGYRLIAGGRFGG